MFMIHIDGLDGSLDWNKPTLAEAIALVTGELKDRRPPINASITDASSEQVVWKRDISATGVISKTE